MIFVFFFPSDFPRRHVGLKLFDSLSICFTVDLRWMVGKPAAARFPLHLAMAAAHFTASSKLQHTLSP